jgi:threonine/homoserine/homoserine lactone efflux protein
LSTETILALLIYAFVSSVTPGPNNLMLLASGVNFGFRRTVPHIFGISAGFLTMLLAVGLGLGAVLEAFPGLHLALKILGGAYLLHLAWRIAMGGPLGKEGNSRARPITFFEAAAFQFVNPKAWVLAVTAMALYGSAASRFWSVTIIAAAFTIVNLPSVSIWAGFGVALRNLLSDPVRLKFFNLAMGLLLAATLFPMLA